MLPFLTPGLVTYSVGPGGGGGGVVAPMLSVNNTLPDVQGSKAGLGPKTGPQMNSSFISAAVTETRRCSRCPVFHNDPAAVEPNPKTSVPPPPSVTW